MNAEVRFASVETRLGPMLLAATPSGIAALSMRASTEAFLAALTRRFPHGDVRPDVTGLGTSIRWLSEYLAAERRDLPPVDVTGIGAWDVAVYAAIRAIPSGETSTYGDIALAVGSPGAARAVGGALSRCPLFPAVPCHRVVMARDGFSGWGGGEIGVKAWLLDLERRH